MYNTSGPLIPALYSGDLFTSMCNLDSCLKQRNSVETSILCNVNVIHHAFEGRFVEEAASTPGKSSIADLGKESESPLNHTVWILMETMRVPFSFVGAETLSRHRSLG